MTDKEKTLAELIAARTKAEDRRESILKRMESEKTFVGTPTGDRRALERNRLADYIWDLNFQIAKLEEGVVYIRWDMDAESYSGRRTFLSVHKTLEGAIAAISENIRKDAYKRDPYANYVANYTYEAIEKIKLGD